MEGVKPQIYRSRSHNTHAPRAHEAMEPYLLEHYGNPIYEIGRQARKAPMRLGCGGGDPRVYREIVLQAEVRY